MNHYQNQVGLKDFYMKEYELKNGQKLIIRNIEYGDEQELINQMKLVDSETKFLAREPGEFNFTIEQEREFIKNKKNNKDDLFLIGEIDHRIIAQCSIGVVSNYKRYLHRAAMGIIICKAYWNLGIGKIIMQEGISWCKEKGIEQLELEVVTQNERAISLYRKFGFQICGTKIHALKYGDGTYADEYEMVLFLRD